MLERVLILAYIFFITGKNGGGVNLEILPRYPRSNLSFDFFKFFGDT